jgi:hypothetical protein
LSLLAAADDADEPYGLFQQPVTEVDVPGYSQVILAPMDFATIRSRLERRLYRELSEVANDVFLCYDNCEHFNADDSVFYQEAQRQRAEVQRAYDALLMGDGDG